VNIPAVPGIYLIIGRLDSAIRLTSGPFAGNEVLSGHYLYSGSARGPGGLFSRISRHLNLETKKFWHFDHLKASLCFEEIIFSANRISEECEFIKEIQKLEGVSFPMPLFGASDCRRQCPAHLARLPLSISIGSVFRILNGHGFKLNKLTLG
jgi:Uri superfamily endonuclease